MRCEVVPARLIHVGPIAVNIRPEDRIECEAMGRTPKDALRNGLRCSLSAFTAIEGGIPVAMFGVVPEALLGGLGRVWFLATPDAFHHARQLLEQGPGIIGSWLETFSRLENEVAAENVKAIRLLKRWGFTVGTKRVVRGGVEFLPFHIERAAIQATAAAA